MLAGAIGAIQYYFTGLADWASLNPLSPPQVPVGTSFHLKIWWQNTGDVTCKGTVEVEITKPNGARITLSPYLGQDTELASGYSTYVQFYSFVFDQVGSYSARIDLKGEEIAGAAGIEVHILNYPGSSYLWNPIIYVPTKANPQFTISPSRYLAMYEYLVYPYIIGGANVSAQMDVTVVDAAYSWVYQKLAMPVLISDGKRYRWNCSTHALEEF